MHADAGRVNHGLTRMDTDGHGWTRIPDYFLSVFIRVNPWLIGFGVRGKSMSISQQPPEPGLGVGH
jgi:hypothetical protein